MYLYVCESLHLNAPEAIFCTALYNRKVIEIRCLHSLAANEFASIPHFECQLTITANAPNKKRE